MRIPRDVCVKREAISSWEDLQREVSAILERLNADGALGLAAAANPLLALEELGYEIEASARPAIEARLRFGPKVAPRALELVDRMRGEVGRPIDPDDEEDVRRAIAELGVTSRGPRQRSSRGTWPKEHQTVETPSGHRLRDEDLEPHRGAHPFIDTLLEYRKLAASAPRLAPRGAFDAIRSGERGLPITRVTGRLQREAGPPGETRSRGRRRRRSGEQ